MNTLRHLLIVGVTLSRLRALVGVLVLAWLLVACGGGGGGGGGAAAVANTAPTASFTVSGTLQPGSVITFNGAGSTDSDGSIASWSWDFGDGNTGTGSSAQNTFASAGSYDVVLTVTDDDGATDTHTITVTIVASSTPPVALFTASAYTGVIGTASATVDFDAFPSYDNETAIASYAWDFGGDGTASGVTTQHTFTVAGSYDVSLTVTDGEGKTDTSTVTIVMADGVSTYTISGQILIPAHLEVDSDVNDVNTTPVSNNVPVGPSANAQVIGNPVTLAGYVNAANAGYTGNSYAAGDTADYYSTTVNKGDEIVLSIADYAVADLDLVLLHASTFALFYATDVGDKRVITGASIRNGSTQTLDEFLDANPSNHAFIVGVSAVGAADASLYYLQIGQGIAAQAHAQADFVPGEVLVQFKPGPLPLLTSVDARARAADLGLNVAGRAVGDARGLRAKFSLGDERNPSSMLGRLIANQRARDAMHGSARFAHPFDAIPGARASSRAKSRATDIKALTLAAVAELRNHPDVLSVEPNYRYHAHFAPNDGYYPLQWHYPLIQLPAAWDIFTGGSTTVTAVIDTGVLQSHPDLTGVFSGDQYDFYSMDADAEDTGDFSGPNQTNTYHGTHVAGTIAASTNNGNNSVASVAFGTKIMPLRVLGSGGGTCDGVANAVLYAAGLANTSGGVPNFPADVINLSLGGGASCQALLDAITDARAAGSIVIAAAGNSASTAPNYPSAFAGVVSVSAVDTRKLIAPYSNRGVTIDVAAPGGDLSIDRDGDGYTDGVLSTAGSNASGTLEYGFLYYEGTSMAAPHVAGVAALMKAYRKSQSQTLSPAEFDGLLAAGDITEDLGAVGRDDLYGHGLIRADKALLAAGGTSALLVAEPDRANFESGVSVIALTLSAPGVPVTVSDVSDDAAWLTITAPGTGDGLGSYTLTVDRTGLDDGYYRATVTATHSGGSLVIPVTMRVSSANPDADAGLHYVLLVDADTWTVLASPSVAANAGVYDYSLTNLDAGSYFIFAGTDLDNDNNVCDFGEACGAWSALAEPQVIDLARTESNVTFSTGHLTNISALQMTVPNRAQSTPVFVIQK